MGLWPEAKPATLLTAPNRKQKRNNRGWVHPSSGCPLPAPLGVSILYQPCLALSNLWVERVETHLTLLFDQSQDANAQRVHRLALVLVERAVVQLRSGGFYGIHARIRTWASPSRTTV